MAVVCNANTVWVRSAHDPATSTYRTMIEVGADRAIGLDAAGALAYANVVLDVRARAMHDAAIVAQMHSTLRLSLQDTAQALHGLRLDRPPLNYEATHPLRFEPVVSHLSHEPFITIVLDGQPVGQWDIHDAADHALAIMEVVAMCDLDTAYLKYLVDTLAVAPSTAAATVSALSPHVSNQEVPREDRQGRPGSHSYRE